MCNNGLSGRLWPIHLKPLEDELLSSWIVRLARAHKVKSHTLCHLTWPGKQIWTRDIDKFADDETLTTLSEKTATPIERVKQTSLAAYEGYLYEHHNPYGMTQWIMPLGIYHRSRKKFGLQFCPACLAEDAEPYFRRSWRLALSTVCCRHVCFLVDRCPECALPISFHRLAPDAEAITVCNECGFDLRQAPQVKCSPLEADQQLEMLLNIERGWARIGAAKFVYSHHYFLVLRQIMRLINGGVWGKRLRGELGSFFPDEWLKSDEGKSLEVEGLSIAKRHRLRSMTTWLLEDWPMRFVVVCDVSRTWNSGLLSYLPNAPFWYEDVVNRYLRRDGHLPYDRKVSNAIGRLRRSRGEVTWEAVCGLVGRATPRKE